MEQLLLRQKFLIEELRRWPSPEAIIALSDELNHLARQIACQPVWRPS
jgi:hypothetical protein